MGRDPCFGSGRWLVARAIEIDDGRESFFTFVGLTWWLTRLGGLEQAVAECISDDALIHLKSYKYSSVDKSPVSKYILGPWVRLHRSSPRFRMTLQLAFVDTLPLLATGRLNAN